MGKIGHFVRACTLVIIFLSLSSCKGAELIIADEPTNVYSDYPKGGNPEPDKVIVVLNKGETGDIIHIRYSKDFMFYKIRLKDGREGYVQYGDKFRVIPKNKQAL